MQPDNEEPRIYLLPNLMTAGNLCCGFIAVLTIFKGMQAADFAAAEIFYKKAMLYIFGACLFDLLDGRLARLGGQESPFGREFDSLADIVSFGMAPALLVSRAVLFDINLPDRYAKAEPGIAWTIAFIYLLCGAMRLARFNCLAAMPNSKSASSDFRGIPIPMAAGFIASLTFLIIRFHNGERTLGNWTWVLVFLMLGVSALMMSNIRYPSFKRVAWKTSATLPLILGVVIVVALMVHYYDIVPAFLFTGYLLYGLVRAFLSKQAKQKLDHAVNAIVPENNEDSNSSDDTDRENTEKQ